MPAYNEARNFTPAPPAKVAAPRAFQDSQAQADADGDVEMSGWFVK